MEARHRIHIRVPTGRDRSGVRGQDPLPQRRGRIEASMVREVKGVGSGAGVVRHGSDRVARSAVRTRVTNRPDVGPTLDDDAAVRARRGRACAVLCIAACSALLSTACADADDDPDAIGFANALPRAGGRLTLAVERMLEPGWTPSRSPCDHSCELVVAAVIDPLAVLDELGEPVPYLAAAIEPVIEVDDGAVPFGSWDLILRPESITFEDGLVLTTDVVAANLLAHRSADAGSAGAVPIHSVDEIDETTLRVHFAAPGDPPGSLAWVEFPAALTGPLGWVVHPDDLVGADARVPRGTGPFVVAEASSTELTLQRRQGYWRDGPDGQVLPVVDSIDVEVSPSEAVRRRRVEIGSLDLALAAESIEPADLEPAPTSSIPPPVVDGLLVGPGSDVLSLVVNSADVDSHGAANPWADEANRVALAGCVDVDRLVGVLPGPPAPATGLFSPGVPGNLSERALDPPELDSAAETLAENEVGGVRVVFGPEDGAEELVTVLAGQLEDRCGLQVTTLGLGAVELDQAIGRGEFDLVLLRLTGGQDPDAQFARWSSVSVRALDDAGANIGRVADPRIEDALDLIRTVPDAAVRASAATALNRTLSESARAVWLAWLAPAVAVSDDLDGIGSDRTPDGAVLHHPTFGPLSLATLGTGEPAAAP